MDLRQPSDGGSAGGGDPSGAACSAVACAPALAPPAGNNAAAGVQQSAHLACGSACDGRRCWSCETPRCGEEADAVLRHLTLQIRQGECWVVHGANGSGKSTLLATLYGEHACCERRGPSGAGISRAGRPTVRLPAARRLRDRTGIAGGAAAPQTALECVVAGMRGAYRLDGVRSRPNGARRCERWAERACARSRSGRLENCRTARRGASCLRARWRGGLILCCSMNPTPGWMRLTRRRLRALVDARVAAGANRRDRQPPPRRLAAAAPAHELELAGGVARAIAGRCGRARCSSAGERAVTRR